MPLVFNSEFELYSSCEAVTIISLGLSHFSIFFIVLKAPLLLQLFSILLQLFSILLQLFSILHSLQSLAAPLKIRTIVLAQEFSCSPF